MLGAEPSYLTPSLATHSGNWGLTAATQGLTLSFTWPELLSRRFRRYSSRHWLLPSDSWEISGMQSG